MTEGLRWLCEGRLWRDRVNGNTYHSYEVTDVKTNEVIISQGLSYGGKSMIAQNVKRDLIALGLLRAGDRYNHELTRNWYYWTYAEVLKRNMFKTSFSSKNALLKLTAEQSQPSEKEKIKASLGQKNGLVRPSVK